MKKIGIIGLGYVGLPLAVEFGKKRPVIGFDIDPERINELISKNDKTNEVSREEFVASEYLEFTSTQEMLSECQIYIVTVPTPIDPFNKPDLSPLKNASKLIGEVLKKADIVIYESTVYPGCTEEECVPILEEQSHLTFNKDFYCGYSPERINPGDKEHRVATIKKVTSGSTPEVAEEVDHLYSEIITAGTHKASSIKVAEAAKVIENTQRDLNIAFVNELSKIFHKLNIDTTDVLEAASTKWNFLPFRPGLVGGHCIGVDPYYLTYKAESLGYTPQVILAGRRINDGMGAYIANRVMKLLTRTGKAQSARILMLGITFKENCPDIRNSRVIDVIHELQDYGVSIDVYDPHASAVEVKKEYGIAMINKPSGSYDAVILAVKHDEFKNINWKEIKNGHTVFFDVKSVLDKSMITERL